MELRCAGPLTLFWHRQQQSINYCTVVCTIWILIRKAKGSPVSELRMQLWLGALIGKAKCKLLAVKLLLLRPSLNNSGHISDISNDIHVSLLDMEEFSSWSTGSIMQIQVKIIGLNDYDHGGCYEIGLHASTEMSESYESVRRWPIAVATTNNWYMPFWLKCLIVVCFF